MPKPSGLSTGYPTKRGSAYFTPYRCCKRRYRLNGSIDSGRSEIMNDITFRAANTEDWPQISDLLQTADLPRDGAQAHLNGFVLALQGQKLVGCAARERYGKTALLRSVATHPDYRGIGLGQELVRRVLDMA